MVGVYSASIVSKNLRLANTSLQDLNTRQAMSANQQEQASLIVTRAATMLAAISRNTAFVFFTFVLRAAYTTAFAAACNSSGSSDPTCGSCDASCQSPNYMLARFFFGSPLLLPVPAPAPLHQMGQARDRSSSAALPVRHRGRVHVVWIVRR